MLNLHELNIFTTAAEQSSFSKAGRILHLSQPAISQTIQNLERRLKTELFVRYGRTIRLTAAGETLLPLARELLANANRLEETMASLHGAVIGRIQIGCSTTSGKYILPGLIARFRNRFPQVRIDVQVTSRDGVLRRLADNKINFGVSSKQIEHHDLISWPIFTDEVILITCPNHPWSRFRRVYVDDLLDTEIVMRDQISGTYSVLMRELAVRNISEDMLNVAMVLGNAESIVSAVEEGIGIAFVSRLAAAHSLALGRVIEVEVEGMSLKRDLYFIRSQRFPASRAAGEFWDYLQNDLSAKTYMEYLSKGKGGYRANGTSSALIEEIEKEL
ncbi:MAG: LysR family transcriptional regulator [Anaerolineaceae bacterium]|nr:LysR family transcriptional regulator [Anaerolineaceae bacterium]